MANLIIPNKTVNDMFALSDFQSDLTALNNDINAVKTYIRAYLTANQAIAGTTWAKIPFNIVTDDTKGEFSTVNNNITLLESGIYTISFNLLWNSASSGSSVLCGIDVGSNFFRCGGAKQGTATGFCQSNGSITVKANANDVVDVKAFLSTGDTVLGSTATYSWLTCTKIR